MGISHSSTARSLYFLLSDAIDVQSNVTSIWELRTNDLSKYLTLRESLYCMILEVCNHEHLLMGNFLPDMPCQACIMHESTLAICNTSTLEQHCNCNALSTRCRGTGYPVHQLHGLRA